MTILTKKVFNILYYFSGKKDFGRNILYKIFKYLYYCLFYHKTMNQIIKTC